MQFVHFKHENSNSISSYEQGDSFQNQDLKWYFYLSTVLLGVEKVIKVSVAHLMDVCCLQFFFIYWSIVFGLINTVVSLSAHICLLECCSMEYWQAEKM